MKWNGKQVFKKLTKQLEKVKNEAPKILANEGQKVFLENFSTQSWNNLPWKNRKKDTGRPILIGRTRRLINSVRKSVRMASVNRIKWASDVPYAAVHNFGLTIEKKASRKLLTWREKSTNLETKKVNRVFASNKGKGRAYLRATTFSYHNVGAHSIKMPRRQFMGVSLKLKKRLRLKFESVFKANLR